MLKKAKFLSLFAIFFFSGCSDTHISQIHSKSFFKKDITCMNLTLFPPNESIANSFNSLYTFTPNCDLDLIASYKKSIVCNSNQNSEKKALGMAKSYLRLELKQKNTLLYSYYIDLDENVKDIDIKNGFKVMKKTLPLR
ncbi:hypothetical protein N9X61_02025 [Sulfurimonas sp.]|nr:hypothetical protein [Sulfurimonas sp.]